MKALLSKFKSLAALILLVANAEETVALRPVVPSELFNLPLGHVKPAGWLYTRLKGGHNLFGRAEGFYDYLSHAETEWIARPTDYYTIETAGSHWFNDMVSVAGVLGIDTLQSQTTQFLDYYLDTQGPDGWLGPEVNTTRPRRLSPRCSYTRFCWARSAWRRPRRSLSARSESLSRYTGSWDAYT
ncbi:hypothetical protein VTO73DRAFT_10553 [Trametes versicolor]